LFNILTAQFRHETNTFSNFPATVESFKSRNLLFGEEMISFFTGVKNEPGAFIDFFRGHDDVRLIPVIAADAMPSGPVTREMYNIVRDATINTCKNQKIDALLLALHGAMVLEDEEDGEGALLEEIRKVVGQEIPIYTALDLHANITDKMVKHASAMFPYDFYPHTDAYERGLEAAGNLYKALKKEIVMVSRFKKLPVLIPFLPTAEEPKKSLLEKVFETEKRDKVISISIVDGFFCADIKECGMSVLVQTNNDERLAEELLEDFSADLYSRRHKLIKEVVPVNEAIATALATEGSPVVLGDVSDNAGCGSPGDGTLLLRSLLEHNIEGAVIAHLYDPGTVEQAVKAGVGHTIQARVGGKSSKVLGEPVECDAYVRLISDGVYFNKDGVFPGLKNRIGRTVVLVIGGIEVIISERRHQPLDVQILRAHGIDPCERKIIAVKSALHFRASYGRIAKKIIDVNLPGIAPADPKLLDFKKVRRPIFPLDDI
jgi:microcystin degradation protein MlrC